MATRTYTIIGTLKNEQTGRGIAGYRVEAWDKDLLFDDALGSAVTGAEGGFRIAFTEARFRDLLGDRRPDLYFRVFDPSGKQVKSTESSVLWNIKAGKTPVEILVDLPEAEPPQPEPSTEPSRDFVVRGTIRLADGRPFGGARVVALDTDIRREKGQEEVPLATAISDQQGRYEITYNRPLHFLNNSA